MLVIISVFIHMMAHNIVHLLTLFVLGYDVDIFWCLLMLLSYLQNTHETAFALRKLSLTKAKRYLEDVIAHKQAIPFRRYCGGVGRTAQAKSRHSNGQGRWPVKSARFILDLLKNAESNAEVYNSTVICQTYLCFHSIMLIM
jgi:large subunit ribosomal protein L17e